MAKTKKEMRKAQANYVDIILRKNKYIKELQDKLQAWDQVNKINQAITAAVLLLRAEGEPVMVSQETVSQMLRDYTVMAKPHKDEDGDLDGYILQLVKLNTEAEKPAE